MIGIGNSLTSEESVMERDVIAFALTHARLSRSSLLLSLTL